MKRSERRRTDLDPWYLDGGTATLALIAAVVLLLACLGLYGPYADAWIERTGDDGSMAGFGEPWYGFLLAVTVGIGAVSALRPLRPAAIILLGLMALFAGWSLVSMALELLR